jgi:hypothetical protein
MGIASADPGSRYLAFFDSIVDENMFWAEVPPTMDDELFLDPLQRLPLPPIVEPLTKDEVTQLVDDRSQATLQKADELRERLKQEKAKIDALIETYQAGQGLDKVLQVRIQTGVSWFESMIKNLDGAIRDHKIGKTLTGVKLQQAIIRRIEQKQLAVEVALQQGPNQEVEDGGQDVPKGDKEEGTTDMLPETPDMLPGMLPEDRLFRMEDANSELIELDLPFFTLEEPANTRRNQPAIGLWLVPKPTENHK